MTHPANGNGHSDEHQPLLGRQNGSSTSPSAFKRRMCADVSRDWADVVLIFCYIITGLLDSAAISTWGSFVSMQTGNSIYLGLGLAAPTEGTRWIKSGVSLGFFCIGSVCFSAFHRAFSPRRRWVLCASLVFQTVLIATAALMLQLGPKSPNPQTDIGWTELVPIALIAFQACGQAVTSRALKYNALTSVVLTSVYCDLFSDARLLAGDNVERNQRLGAPVCLIFGAVVGGLIAHTSFSTAGTLWLAALLKLVVAFTWFVWPAETK
ncbi:uncharacterized protein B0I36DRAFT_309233 [Microdochium trichocladiopsis]|uniref:DUF1275 domain protein n=1 Tax=Microdochium trichocladiopsis TaxID=1682393 RepID=A0A9P8YGW4_9PEZI|nr:uncharacterized protein B0I36DRAFT_309233 [Microdochium trichocladiopsis]KAH7039758.1 hypothetical protein B0I36DRAFT_309233 [Microdochium trichocladiopsis]